MEREERVLESRPPRRAYAAGAAAAAAAAIVSTVWAYLEYAWHARPALLSLALAGIFFGLAATVLLGFRGAFAFESVQGPRPLPPPAQAPVDMTKGRRGFLGLMAAAGSALLAVVLLPLRSLGSWPRNTLHATAWRRGVRLLTPDGVPLRPDDVPPGGTATAVPATSPEDTNSIAVVVRLRGSNALRAYSRICTHAGCAVCVFRADESQLVCPCHSSIFDAASDGRVVRGPSSKPLPQLPLAVGADGVLVADGDFNRSVGPRGGRG